MFSSDLCGVPLEDLMAEDFAWQEGWEYRLPSVHAPRFRRGRDAIIYAAALDQQ